MGSSIEESIEEKSTENIRNVSGTGEGSSGKNSPEERTEPGITIGKNCETSITSTRNSLEAHSNEDNAGIRSNSDGDIQGEEDGTEKNSTEGEFAEQILTGGARTAKNSCHETPAKISEEIVSKREASKNDFISDEAEVDIMRRKLAGNDPEEETNTENILSENCSVDEKATEENKIAGAEVPNENKDDFFPILDVAPLVFERVVSFLDYYSHKRFRFTCTAIKKMLDSPQCVKHLAVKLNRSNFYEVVDSTTSWNSFTLVVFDDFPTKKEILKWTEKFGASMKKLWLRRYFDSSATRRFADVFQTTITHLDTLEFLEVDELDITKVGCAYDSQWIDILRHLKSIQELHIHSIVRLSEKTKHYFRDILDYAYNVKRMTLPRLLETMDKECPDLYAYRAAEYEKKQREEAGDDEDDYEQDERELEERRRACREKLFKEYVKYFVEPMLEKINRGTTVTSLFIPEELVTEETYLRIAETCYKKSITLGGSGPYFGASPVLRIPTRKLFVTDRMGSIAGISEDVMRHPCPLLKVMVISRNYFCCTTKGPMPVPEFPRLLHIGVYLSSWKPVELQTTSLQQVSEFITALGSTERPSVQNIIVSSVPQRDGWTCPHANLIRPNFLYAFINLTGMILDSVQYTSDEFLQMWQQLPRLEKIEVRKAAGMDDNAVTGANSGSNSIGLLGLKELRELILNGCGNITPFSYENTFSKMKLARFQHDPYPAQASNVSPRCFPYLVNGTVWGFLEEFQSLGDGFRTHSEKLRFAYRYRDIIRNEDGRNVEEESDDDEEEEETPNRGPCFMVLPAGILLEGSDDDDFDENCVCT